MHKISLFDPQLLFVSVFDIIFNSAFFILREKGSTFGCFNVIFYLCLLTVPISTFCSLFNVKYHLVFVFEYLGFCLVVLLFPKAL